MAGRFEGCLAYIYTEDGKLVTKSKITEHAELENHIKIYSSPELLSISRCALLIMTPKIPYMSCGVIHPEGGYVRITLYKVKEKENRRSERYNISSSAIITHYIDGDKSYKLHTPMVVLVVNISKNGIRLRLGSNGLLKGDKFNIYMKFGDNLKKLTAVVVNNCDVDKEHSEYGCLLLGDEDGKK